MHGVVQKIVAIIPMGLGQLFVNQAESFVLFNNQ